MVRSLSHYQLLDCDLGLHVSGHVFVQGVVSVIVLEMYWR